MTRLTTTLRSLEQMLATVSFGLSPIARYVVAVALVGIALEVRLLIAPPEGGVPFLTFFPAAAISAIIGGLGPGLVACVLGAALAVWQFIPLVDTTSWLSMLIFMVDGVIVCTAIEAMRRYYRRNAEMNFHLERTVERLSSMNAELARFAYVASHDLQEPLRSITSFSQLLVRDYSGRLDQRGLESLGFVIDGGRRMHQLINDLLAYSRATQQGSLRRGWVDANGALQAVRGALAEAIDACGAEIAVGPLPTVWVNDIQMIELLEHLVGNAIKFRAPDRPPRISVTCRRHDDAWLFAVTDNGIGFDPTTADVFEIFRQLHPRGTFGGQGLGLALCRRIVLDHEGRIWADSVPGRGTTIQFTLPAQA